MHVAIQTSDYCSHFSHIKLWRAKPHRCSSFISFKVEPKCAASYLFLWPPVLLPAPLHINPRVFQAVSQKLN